MISNKKRMQLWRGKSLVLRRPRVNLTYFCSLWHIHRGVCLEVTFVLSTQDSCDDEDDHRNHSNGSQDCSNDPQVVGWVFHHSCIYHKREVITYSCLVMSPNMASWKPIKVYCSIQLSKQCLKQVFSPSLLPKTLFNWWRKSLELGKLFISLYFKIYSQPLWYDLSHHNCSHHLITAWITTLSCEKNRTPSSSVLHPLCKLYQ